MAVIANEQTESTVDQKGAGVQKLSLAQADTQEDEGGYGWVCVVCTFLINVHTWGINSVCPFQVNGSSRPIYRVHMLIDMNGGNNSPTVFSSRSISPTMSFPE